MEWSSWFEESHLRGSVGDWAKNALARYYGSSFGHITGLTELYAGKSRETEEIF